MRPSGASREASGGASSDPQASAELGDSECYLLPAPRHSVAWRKGLPPKMHHRVDSKWVVEQLHVELFARALWRLARGVQGRMRSEEGPPCVPAGRRARHSLQHRWEENCQEVWHLDPTTAPESLAHRAAPGCGSVRPFQEGHQGGDAVAGGAAGQQPPPAGIPIHAESHSR